MTEAVGLLCDTAIRARCEGVAEPMITPLVTRQIRYAETFGLVMGQPRYPVISYGLTSYGYDVRLANDFHVFAPLVDNEHTVIDPKHFHSAFLREVQVRDHEALIIPPHAYALGHSVERFAMPDDVTGICVGKSTYARCGVLVNVTPLEAGWRGYVTIEIANTTSLPVKVYAAEGIMQVLFYAAAACAVTYAQRMAPLAAPMSSEHEGAAIP